MLPTAFDCSLLDDCSVGSVLFAFMNVSFASFKLCIAQALLMAKPEIVWADLNKFNKNWELPVR